MSEQIDSIRQRLEMAIADFHSVVVGYSAGVDSSVVAAAATASLGSRALIVTAITETITDEDVSLASRIAQDLNFSHELIRYNELEIVGYADNPSNRCYYCKDALYVRLRALADDRGIETVLDGTNADDADDYRPGRQAAHEQGVRSPLLELGITKNQVRELARVYGLPNHDKPSAPCLSSRVPYGTQITPEILRKVGDAERRLRELGYREFRVRYHGDVARVEIPREEFSEAIHDAERIDAAIRAVGFTFVALDLRGLRSGSLNETLTQIEIPSL